MSRRKLNVGAVLCALAVVSAASASGDSDPGVTSKSILIGGTTPLSGPASAFQSVAKGADAYFKYVNAKGGVNERKIKYKYVDDAYEPPQTVQATKQLVQQDKVFAIFNSLGTEQNLATRAFLNAAKVPQLFVASGGVTFGRDYKKYPWTIGYLPNYIAEGEIYGRYIARSKPKAKIGILFQNDDFGKELIKGFRKGLGSKAKAIVSKQGYDVNDADVKSQIARLKASKANTLMVFATPKFAIQTYSFTHQLGWKPQFVVAVVSSAANVMLLSTYASNTRHVEGSISIVFLKDPTDPRWAKSPGIRLYKSIMKKYGRGNVKDVYNVYGMSAAFSMVDALKHAGKKLTRKSIMRAATHLNERNDPFVLPGMIVRTSPSSRFPISQAKLERWHNGRWVFFGPLVSAR